VSLGLDVLVAVDQEMAANHVEVIEPFLEVGHVLAVLCRELKRLCHSIHLVFNLHLCRNGLDVLLLFKGSNYQAASNAQSLGGVIVGLVLDGLDHLVASVEEFRDVPSKVLLHDKLATRVELSEESKVEHQVVQDHQGSFLRVDLIMELCNRHLSQNGFLDSFDFNPTFLGPDEKGELTDDHNHEEANRAQQLQRNRETTVLFLVRVNAG